MKRGKRPFWEGPFCGTSSKWLSFHHPFLSKNAGLKVMFIDGLRLGDYLLVDWCAVSGSLWGLQRLVLNLSDDKMAFIYGLELNFGYKTFFFLFKRVSILVSIILLQAYIVYEFVEKKNFCYTENLRHFYQRISINFFLPEVFLSIFFSGYIYFLFILHIIALFQLLEMNQEEKEKCFVGPLT